MAEPNGKSAMITGDYYITLHHITSHIFTSAGATGRINQSAFNQLFLIMLWFRFPLRAWSLEEVNATPLAGVLFLGIEEGRGTLFGVLHD
jgi:hypothetical protein